MKTTFKRLCSFMLTITIIFNVCSPAVYASIAMDVTNNKSEDVSSAEKQEKDITTKKDETSTKDKVKEDEKPLTKDSKDSTLDVEVSSKDKGTDKKQDDKTPIEDKAKEDGEDTPKDTEKEGQTSSKDDEKQGDKLPSEKGDTLPTDKPKGGEAIPTEEVKQPETLELLNLENIESDKTNKITEFNTLEDSVLNKKVLRGTDIKHIDLPETLIGTIVNGETTNKDRNIHVDNWKSEPEYDNKKAGKYIFSPVISADYVLQDKVELPKITIELIEGTKDNPYQISTKEDLIFLSDSVNKNIVSTVGFHAELNNDIDLSGVDWTPIGTKVGTAQVSFNGDFNGNNHCINNLLINHETKDYLGLFANTNGATIKNLTVNGEITGSRYVGGIVGQAVKTNIENCINNVNVTGKQNIGGIVGYSNETITIKDCINNGKITATGTCVGGITGWSNGNSNINNCHNKGDIKGQMFVGGITGKCNGKIEKSSNEANIKAMAGLGGIAGYLKGTATECYNTSVIEGTGLNVGGIIGLSDTSTSIEKSYNTGKVGGKENVGGITGCLKNSNITDCYNTETITGKKSVAGIAGKNIPDRNKENNINNCYNLAQIEVPIAIKTESAKVKNCYYLSDKENNEGGKTAESFNSGEVTWLLNNDGATPRKVWSLADCDFTGVLKVPSLQNGDNVYKVVFENDDIINGKDYGKLVSKNKDYYITGETVVFEQKLNDDVTGKFKTKIVRTVPNDIKINNNSFAMPNSDVSISYKLLPEVEVGKEFTIIFDNDGKTEEQKVKYPEKIKEPKIPIKEGNTFLGWFLDGAKDKYDFDKEEVLDNFTLYAKWDAKKYTITFDTQNGVNSKSETVEYGNTIKVPTIPIKTGHNFEGWYEGSIVGGKLVLNEKSFDFTEQIKREETNITLYAKWEPKTYKFIFNWNDKEENNSTKTTKDVKFGELLKNPADDKDAIKKDGMMAEWYLDKDFKTIWDFDKTTIDDKMAQADDTINLYARCCSDIKSDTSWFKDTETKFTLTKAEELYGLASLVNSQKSDFSGKTVILSNDIDLGNAIWEPIGVKVEPTKDKPEPKDIVFKGTFDGNKHTISGLYINDDKGTYKGLFACIDGNAVIKDLTVSGKITASSNIAGLVAYMKDGAIKNVTNNVNINAKGIKNQFNRFNPGIQIGGIVGKQDKGLIENCTNKGSLSGKGSFGGICGESTNIVKCYNLGDIDGKSIIGGISSINKGTISECINKGKINNFESDSGNYIGGIAGESSDNSKITRCTNSGVLTGKKQGSVGGVVAVIKKEVEVSKCINTADIIDCTEPYYGVGGIVGCSLHEDTIIKENINKGKISGDKNIGGIISYVGLKSTNIINNYNIGIIEIKEKTLYGFCGGILGYQEGDKDTITLHNNYNASKITGNLTTKNYGSLFGCIISKNVNIHSNFFDKDLCDIGELSNRGKNIEKTTKEMKSDDFIEEIGDIFFAKDTKNINDGYPILYWQKEDKTDGIKVTYHFNDDAKMTKTLYVSSGEKAKELDLKKYGYTKIDYIFTGWYETEDCKGDKFDFNKPIIKDINLYGAWEKDEHTITYYLSHNPVVKADKFKPQICNSKNPSSIRPKDMPEYKGYQFIDWYEGNKLEDGTIKLEENPFKFGKKVEKDINLYAKWNEVNADYTWYNASQSSFSISTPEQLVALSNLVNGTAPKGISEKAVNFQDKTITLSNDIDIKGINWIPIGQMYKPFRGIFDGNNKTIFNIESVLDTKYQGLFGYVNGNIENLTLKNGFIKNATDSSGAICGYLKYYQKDLDNSKEITDPILKNCHNKNVKIEGDSINGGIVGSSTVSFAEIENCSNTGTVSGSTAGGIIGRMSLFGAESDKEKKLNILHCTNSGNITGKMVGGIVGLINGTQEMKPQIEYCKNNGNISTKSSGYAGGIAGSISNTDIGYCYNLGNISGDGTVGGLVGTLKNYLQISKIYSSYSIGEITTTKGGSILGENTDKSYKPIVNTYALDCTKTDKVWGVLPTTKQELLNKQLCHNMNQNVDGDYKPAWAQGKEYPIFADEKNKAIHYAKLDKNFEHGTVIIDKPYVVEGDIVTITATPKDSLINKYETVLVSVIKKSDNTKIKVTNKNSTNENIIYNGDNSFVMPDDDVIVKVRFDKIDNGDEFIVKFDANKGSFKDGTNKKQFTVQKMKPLDKLSEDPIKEGAIFKYWYKDNNINDEYDFDSLVTRKFTLHAKWQQEGYVDVIFDMNGEEGTAPDSTSVKIGDKIPKPTEPKLEKESKKIFKYWTKDRDGKEPWDFNKDITTKENVKNETVTLYAQWSEKTFEVIQGIGTEDEPFEISDDKCIEELNKFLKEGETFTNNYFKLTKNIELSEPIGYGEAKLNSHGYLNKPSVKTAFGGHFIGNNKTVTLNLEAKDKPVQGMFACLGASATVENVTVTGKVEGTYFVGGIAGYSEGTIQKCKSSVNVKGELNIGGICGYSSKNIENCNNSGNVIGTGSQEKILTEGIGGIVGRTTANIKNCTNKGQIEGNGLKLGGIVGTSIGSIDDCNNKGKISTDKVQSSIGGIAGQAKEINKCTNEGIITSEKASTVGGIVGEVVSKITDCSNTGNIIGKSDVGGITGSSGSFADMLTYNCINEGNVTGESIVGGVVGKGGTVHSVNKGAITGSKENIGGISGFSEENIEYSCNLGAIKADKAKNVGGVVGKVKDIVNINAVVIGSFSYECSSTGKAVVPGAKAAVGEGKSDSSFYCTGPEESAITRGFRNAISFLSGPADTTPVQSKEEQAKTPEQFASGEVAYLMDNANSTRTENWGQKLGQDNYPVFADSDHLPIYAATGNNQSSGSVTVNGKQVHYGEKGSTVSVSASANNGYEFISLYVNGKAYSKSLGDFTVGENGKDLTATGIFKRIGSSGGSGGGTGGGTGNGNGTGTGDGNGDGIGNGSSSGSGSGSGSRSGRGSSSNKFDNNSQIYMENATATQKSENVEDIKQEIPKPSMSGSGSGGGGNKKNNIPKEPKTAPASSNWFEVSNVVETIKQNPLVSLCVALSTVLLISLSGIKRYRRYRKDIDNK